MEGTPLADADSGAASKGGEQTSDETTIMAPNAIARGIFSSMGETSGHGQQKRARKVHAHAPTNNFSAAYFRKFYLTAATRVVTAAEMRGRAALIASALKQCQIPVRRILDAGCGIGLLRKPFAEIYPAARYVGLEASDYLCRKYHWTRGSVIDFKPKRPSDLAVCYDVLQYLDDRHSGIAIANLARLCRGALYFTVLTRQDWLHNCDRKRTDADVHLRSAAWYRARLRRGFREIGAGFWLARHAPLTIWELETTGR